LFLKAQENRQNIKGKQPAQKTPPKQEEKPRRQPQNKQRLSGKNGTDAEQDKPMTLLQLSQTTKSKNLSDAQL